MSREYHSQIQNGKKKENRDSKNIFDGSICVNVVIIKGVRRHASKTVSLDSINYYVLSMV